MRKRLRMLAIGGLAVVAALFVVNLARIVLVPTRHIEANGQQARKEELGAIPANPVFAPPAFETFAEIDQRPIFNPTRRPVVKPKPEEEKPVEIPPPDAALIGVVIDGDMKVAVMRVGGAELQNLKIGDGLAGWSITKIEPELVELSLETRVQTYALQGAQNAAAGIGFSPMASSADVAR